MLTIMKINFFVAAICLIAAVLLGYLTYSIAHGDEYDVLCGITSGLCFFSALVPMLAIKSYDSKIKTNLNAVCSLFFFFFLAINICFASLGVVIPYYIILNGLLLLVMVLIIYKIITLKKI